ncbi:MAG: glycosyltransferase, exosortase A system-associated [Nitrospirota bacterium]|nr:glycosyltransferase, exosortase A system-associated [Nitrospirota bacterium]
MANDAFAPKVLHVLDHSLPLHSGYAFRSQNILQCQRNLGWHPCAVTSIKHQLSLKSQGAHCTDEQIDGIQFYRSDFSPRMTGEYSSQFQVVAKLWATLKRVIDIEQPDVLHVHSPALNVLPALVLGRKLGIPVVYEIRAFWEDAAVDHGSYREFSWKYRLVHALETWACRKVSHLAVLCEGLKHDLQKRGISDNHMTIVPNGIHAKDFQPCPADENFRHVWGLDGKIVIGFVGSFYRYEGLDVLVEAFSRLLKKRNDVVLLLVGGGEVEEELKAQVQRLSLGSHVIFPGRIPHERIPGVYGLFDILVYPRHSIRLTELVTPLKPLEAMAMEKPVVASDIGGHRELIRDGETGVLFQAGSAESLSRTLEELLRNSDRMQQLVKQGKTWVTQERSWEKNVKRYATIYEKVLRPVA